MADIFNEQIREALECAQKLRLSGEIELSKQMCQKAVKKVSMYNGEDLIAFFYSPKAYDEINDAADAAKYIFISKCAMNAYDLIISTEPAGSVGSTWAVQDKSSSNRYMQEFFTWLSRSDRRVETTDCNRFKKLLTTMSGYDVIRFKMTDRIKSLRLRDIVSGLVLNHIIITADGELK